MTKKTMTTRYLLLLLTLSISIGSACSSEGPAGNAPGHSGMDHNSAPGNAANQNPSGNTAMDHSTMGHPAMESSPNAASADYDLQFIDTMIVHHQGAVDMAKLIDSRAQHAELKALGRNILSSQQKEIDEMRAWRDNWFAGKPPAININMPGMASSMSGMEMNKLASLSGNAFDLEFLRQMTPHHEGAIVMAKEALQRSKKDEIKRLANEIIKAQDAEISQMGSWLKAWSK